MACQYGVEKSPCPLQRNGQRAGDDLCLLPIGRDVDIGRAHVLDKFFRAHKAIVKNQVIGNAKLFCQCLQALRDSARPRAGEYADG